MFLPDVIRRVVKEHKLAALARIVTFEAKLRPATVVGDGEKIRTIVDNLISNAIKYSPRSGMITISLATEKGFAVLDVIDQGHGIGPEERHHIFESFYQGQPPTEGRVKGSGLGLAIAREYALAQGGRIEVMDRADGKAGAQFRLWLPLTTSGEGCGGGHDGAGADHDTGAAVSDGCASSPRRCSRSWSRVARLRRCPR